MVRFKQKFKNPIKLEDIKKNSSLSEIPLIKQSRLSVMPIDSKSWKILNKMGNIQYAKKIQKKEKREKD